MEQDKQTDIDEQEVHCKWWGGWMRRCREWGKNVETDLVHDSKPVASIFSRIQNSNIPH